jgi:carboxyl-terminal processing protease
LLDRQTLPGTVLVLTEINKTKHMMRGLIALFLLIGVSAYSNQGDTTSLVPKKVYGKEAKVISYLLDNYHFRKIGFTDSLSSIVFDAYLSELDPSRTYFLESDIKAFEPYRFKIDDYVNQENVDVAFSIYKVFKMRYMTQMDYVIKTLVNKEFDYTIDEYYDSDRDKAPWAKNTAELNDIWRKIVKSQALSLKLSGKKQQEISQTLKTRFERFQKSIVQFNSEDVFSIFMNAITESYDPHTNYLSPKASDLFKQSMSLSLEGIGARLQTENDYTKVFEIIPGGPAEKSSKIHVNDFIIGVAQGDDGEMVDVIGWRVDDVVKLIKGPKGTVVRLQILSAAAGIGGTPETVRMVRDKIKLEDQAAKKSVMHYRQGTKDMKMGVITLPSFYMDFEAFQKNDPNYKSTTKDVRRLIGELEKESIDGLVIDLRNNGGGSLSEAIDLTGLFIKNGPVVQVKSSDNRIEVGMDDDNTVAYNGPLVVLTNRFSASASEIFAGAIQDYNRGVIVGESTFGKGTVQTVLNLKPYVRSQEPVGELKLTYQKFYRVSGSSTQHKGVTPDVLLPAAYDADKFGESASLTALPWDVIKKANYQKVPYVNEKLLAQVKKSYQSRATQDPKLKQYYEDIDELHSSIAQTKVSLNESVRKKEMEEAELRKSKYSKLDTKIKNKETGTDDLSSMKDEFLREGLLILTELINNRIG